MLTFAFAATTIVAAAARAPPLHKMLPSPLDDNSSSSPPWSFVGGRWVESMEAAGSYAAPTACNPRPDQKHFNASLPYTNGCINHTLAFYTGQRFGDFDAEFEFAYPVKPTIGDRIGAADNFCSAGLIFGAQNASTFWVLDFPTVGHIWTVESFWVSLSIQRPDGWRRGIHLQQLLGLSSTPGPFHSAKVSLIGCGGGAPGEAGDERQRGAEQCVLRVAVDGNPMQPLMDGMPLANGMKVELPRGAHHIGLVGTNGHGAAKPAFRHLAVAAPPPPVVVAASADNGAPTSFDLTPPRAPWGNVLVGVNGSVSVQPCGQQLLRDGSKAILMPPCKPQPPQPAAAASYASAGGWPRSTDGARTWSVASFRGPYKDGEPASCGNFRRSIKTNELQCYDVATTPCASKLQAGCGPYYLVRATSARYGEPFGNYSVVQRLDLPASWGLNKSLAPNGTDPNTFDHLSAQFGEHLVLFSALRRRTMRETKRCELIVHVHRAGGINGPGGHIAWHSRWILVGHRGVRTWLVEGRRDVRLYRQVPRLQVQHTEGKRLPKALCYNCTVD
jgi:hypothetical protein